MSDTGPVGQVVKTAASHAANRSSTLLRVTSSLPGVLRSVSTVGLRPLGENCAMQARRSLQTEAKQALRFAKVKGEGIFKNMGLQMSVEYATLICNRI